MLIGGYAVILHGYVRGTGDLDVWFNPTTANVNRLYQALVNAGIDTNGMSAEDFRAEGFFRIGREPDRIDLMNRVKGVSFDEAYARRLTVKDQGLPISVIEFEDLLKNKAATARPSDFADLDALKRLRPDESSGRRESGT